VQYLGVGEVKTESFTVFSLDGTSKLVSFTITGANDAPTLDAITAGSVADAVNSAALWHDQ
jgi:VCBS repeat-containing protein